MITATITDRLDKDAKNPNTLSQIRFRTVGFCVYRKATKRVVKKKVMDNPYPLDNP